MVVIHEVETKSPCEAIGEIPGFQSLRINVRIYKKYTSASFISERSTNELIVAISLCFVQQKFQEGRLLRRGHVAAVVPQFAMPSS